MPPELTADEAAFFATGELPASLLAEATPPAAEPPAITPAVVPAPALVPAEAVVPDPLAELQARFVQEQEARIAAEARLSEARRVAATPAPAPTPTPQAAPDPATDPLGAMMHQMRTMAEKMASMETKLTTQQNNEQQQQQFQQFTQTLHAVRDEFTKTHPDFQEAYAHLRATRSADLLDVGVPKERINEALLADEAAVANTAIQTGKNPAEVIYKMAQRYGYVAKAAPAAPVVPATKVANIVAGAKGTKTVAPAAPTGTEMSFESLKDAGDRELSSLVQDDKMWQRVVGGRGGNDIF